ncbi:MAG: UDP-2-acetamido-2,6-dideoxy-hexulose 4-reductase [Paenibacillaceae bacterium]|jgi:GDP-4-dehydro-6-deoxy-D-mannose reductase|nr:UDP-2-acetamido-2,6-dideoxy-hexulose 4-reductase [Paenibacillaceae bacterium]
MKDSTVLITGAGGFTGRHACRHFAAHGYSVAAAVRREDGVPPEGRLYVCDLTDKAEVKRLVEETQPRFVLHLAGRNAVADSWKDPLGCLEANLLSTLYLLEALRGRENCRLLVAGSMLGFDLSDSPQPLHPYSLAKTMQVLTAQAWSFLYSQEVLVAKPSNLIGPGYSNGICGLLASRIARWEKGTDASHFRLSSWHEKRDYLDVRDAVSAYRAILESGQSGAVYPVCSGTMRSLGDLVVTYQQLTPLTLPIEIGQNPPLPPPLPMDTTVTQSLGWLPAIPFGQSLSDALDFYRGALT